MEEKIIGNICLQIVNGEFKFKVLNKENNPIIIISINSFGNTVEYKIPIDVVSLQSLGSMLLMASKTIKIPKYPTFSEEEIKKLIDDGYPEIKVIEIDNDE